MIICDERKNPACELVGLNTTHDSSSKILNQSKWVTEQKDNVWMLIVKQKIKNQITLLESLNITVPDQLYCYLNNVKPGDNTNMEGMAARLYFRELFGKNFTRRSDNLYNAPLNYGYSILLSEVNRVVVSHGYTTALGINHHSVKNPFNLSCDIVEPFRPIVDKLVYLNGSKPFDDSYRKQFYTLNSKSINYNGKVVTLSQAINDYTISITNAMSYNLMCIPEVSLAR